MSSGQRTQTVRPAGYREFARVMSEAVKAGRTVRMRGGGTKFGWGSPPRAGVLNLSTAQLNRAGFSETTATFSAGVALSQAHTLLARRGRMLALDPPTGGDTGATIGGVIATADSGPFAHAYGGARAQVLGMLVALSDGTLVRSSEYLDGDLPSLMTGSYGTLGAILEVTLATHPLPSQTVTVAGTTADGRILMRAAAALTAGAASARAVDFAWQQGNGGLAALLAAEPASDEAHQAVELLTQSGLSDVTLRSDGDELWARQRSGQRSRDRVILRVTGPPTTLPGILAAADDAQATVVGRAALPVCYVTINVNQISVVRGALPAGCHAVVTDAPVSARGAIDPWGPPDPSTLRMMRAVKQRLDPSLACSPGVFVGGI